MADSRNIDLYYSENAPPVICSSIAELDAHLDRLHEECQASRPICVDIRTDDFAVNVGLGVELTFICIQRAPFDGEYYQSVGDEKATGCLDLYGCGNYTPIDRRTLVPMAVIRRAIREFFAHQTLLNDFSWEDWAGNSAPHSI